MILFEAFLKRFWLLFFPGWTIFKPAEVMITWINWKADFWSHAFFNIATCQRAQGVPAHQSGQYTTKEISTQGFLHFMRWFRSDKIGLTILSTEENANSEETSWKVAWCTEHFSPWRLKCSENHATFHKAKPGQYVLLCNVLFSCFNSVRMQFSQRSFSQKNHLSRH